VVTDQHQYGLNLGIPIGIGSGGAGPVVILRNNGRDKQSGCQEQYP